MSRLKSLSAALLFLWLLPACSLPRIVVLHDPLSADEHLQLARIYDAEEKANLAREQYQAAVKADPRHTQAWMLLGDFAFRTKEFSVAQNAYEKAIILDPANGDAHNNLAWVYLESSGNAEKARQLALKALFLTPDHKPFYLDTLGVALIRLGSLPEAVTAIRESIATLPSNRPELAIEAYEHLAEACLRAGDEPCAAEAIRKARQLRNLR